jgi:hypothetical protein
LGLLEVEYKPLTAIIVLFIAIFLLGSGTVDVDWMIVAPRFNPWYFTVDYWEFCPWFRLGWWNAYIFTLARIVAGSMLLGADCVWMYIAIAGKKK